MAQSIDVVIAESAVLANGEAGRYAADVRMRGVHAAVDDGHQDAISGAVG
jgi:hypothetical protein